MQDLVLPRNLTRPDLIYVHTTTLSQTHRVLPQ